jgi:two-component system CheB/CheR fusion protein
MELGEQRIRRVLSVFRTMAAHMGAHSGNSLDAALHLSGRIGAIGRALLAPHFLDGIDFEALVRDEFLLNAAPAAQMTVSGSELRLAPKAAELMSLLIHELTTNSVKYGALSQPAAKIRVTWQIASREDSRILQFEWLETGVRLGTGAAFYPGFGTEVIERLIARELHGEGKMIFMPGGVHCTVEIPLNNVQPRHG